MNLAAVVFRRRGDADGKGALYRLSPSELNAILIGAQMAKESKVQRASVVLVGEDFDRELIAYCRAFGFDDAYFVNSVETTDHSAPWGVNEVISIVRLLDAHLILAPQYPQGLEVIDPTPVACAILGYEYIANVSSLSVEGDQVHISQSLASSEILFTSERPSFAAMTPTSSELRPRVADEIVARSMEVTTVTPLIISETVPSPVEVSKVTNFVRPSIRSKPVSKRAPDRRDQLLEGTPKRSKVAITIDPKDGANLILEKINEIRR